MEVEGEQAPQHVGRRAVGGAAADVLRRPGLPVGHASARSRCPCRQQPGQVLVVGGPAARPRRRRRPGRAPGRRTSAARRRGRCPSARAPCSGRPGGRARTRSTGRRRARRGATIAGRVGAVGGGPPSSCPSSRADDDLVGRRRRTGSPSVRWTSRASRLVAVLEHVERAVVEDRAVLVDLDQRRAAVLGGRAQHLGEVLAVGVHGPRDERRLGAEGQRHRVERGVHRAHRRRLGDLADLGGGGVLALGQAVDPVVEQQDLEVDVAAQRVDQVVAADRQRVAVTGDDPHRQVRPRGGQAGGDGRRAAVDRVHAVGVEVVGEARGAADARDEDDVLALEAELGQEALHRGEDRVVAAAGAPAHLLVGGELLLGLRAVHPRRGGARRAVPLQPAYRGRWCSSAAHSCR